MVNKIKLMLIRVIFIFISIKTYLYNLMVTFACVDCNHSRNDAYLVKILLIYLLHLRISLYAMLFNIWASIIYVVCDKFILLERKKWIAKSSRVPHATSCGETEAWCWTHCFFVFICNRLVYLWYLNLIELVNL